MSTQNKKILKFINEGREQNGYETFKSLGAFEKFRGKILNHEERMTLLKSHKELEDLCRAMINQQKGKSQKELEELDAKRVLVQDTDG